MLLWPGTLAQIVVIAAAGLVGWRLSFPGNAVGVEIDRVPVSRMMAAAAALLFFALLVLLPLAANETSLPPLQMFDSFYRSGALVFGGGHVVLPLLQSEVVPRGWVTNDVFLAGYGAAQAVPGPLFTFAAYLGASMRADLNGWLGAGLCLTAIFLPSFLLVIAALPHWHRLRANRWARSALAGVNAGVVGLLLAALYQPVWTSAIASGRDFALALAAFALLAVWRISPWIIVVLTALGGAALAR